MEDRSGFKVAVDEARRCPSFKIANWRRSVGESIRSVRGRLTPFMDFEGQNQSAKTMVKYAYHREQNQDYEDGRRQATGAHGHQALVHGRRPGIDSYASLRSPRDHTHTINQCISN